MNPVTFVERMYAAGAKGSFDALAYHPYLYAPDNVRFSKSGARELYDGIRQQMVDNGDGGKQIWATEYGESDDGRGRRHTGRTYLRDFLVKWRTLRRRGTGVRLHHPRPQHRQQRFPRQLRRVSHRLDAEARGGRDAESGLGRVGLSRSQATIRAIDFSGIGSQLGRWRAS